MANSRWNTFVNTTFSNLTSRSGTQKLAGCLLAKHLYQFTAPHWGSETPHQSCQFKPLDSRTCQTAVTDAPFALVHSVQEDLPPRAEERTHNGQTWIGSDGAPCQPSLPITHLPFLANLCDRLQLFDPVQAKVLEASHLFLEMSDLRPYARCVRQEDGLLWATSLLIHFLSG